MGFAARFLETFRNTVLMPLGVGILALGLGGCSASSNATPVDSVETSVLRCAPNGPEGTGGGPFAEVSITNLDAERSIELVEVVVRFADDQGNAIGDTALAFRTDLPSGSSTTAYARSNTDQQLDTLTLAQCDIVDLMVIWARE